MMKAVTREWPWTSKGVPPERDDRALLAAVATGDGAALTELYRRHSRALFGYLIRVCGDRSVAEEVLQDTLVALWQGADGFAERSSVRVWIFGIARRQAIQRLRRRPAPIPTELPERPDPALGPDEIAVLATGGTAVAAAVSALPVHHREVVALVMVAGLPLAEAARILDVPVGTVKSRIARGRAALAVALRDTSGNRNPSSERPSREP
jgi:RNA polymerase sigma factor (sigma-70 family)